MKVEQELYTIVLDIYREAYSLAEPKADFDKLCESGIATEPEFFHRYHLNNDIQNEIVERHIKKHKLMGWEANAVRTEAHTGRLPCSCGYKNPKHRKSTGDEDG